MVESIRIAQREWAGGTAPLGASGLPVARGVVRGSAVAVGVGMIAGASSEEDVFSSPPSQGRDTAP
jgi:hypothetical protein